jgi:prepilin-type N-terminal cleavage/methylation domain-containing protein
MKIPKYSQNGFTLLELLVVIAIISFLLAITVPAMGRAKDQSRVIICRNNQKNLLVKCLVYSGDNNSSLPVDKQLHNPHTGLIQSLSDECAQESKIYYCPSERADDLKFAEDNFKNGDIGYFYYCFSDRPTCPDLSTFFLKKLPWPRLLKDTMRADIWVFSDSWFSSVPTAHRWYKKGVNYITLDGAIHMVKESPKDNFN